jgi:hypothetical protein
MKIFETLVTLEEPKVHSTVNQEHLPLKKTVNQEHTRCLAVTLNF